MVVHFFRLGCFRCRRTDGSQASHKFVGWIKGAVRIVESISEESEVLERRMHYIFGCSQVVFMVLVMQLGLVRKSQVIKFLMVDSSGCPGGDITRYVLVHHMLNAQVKSC